VLVATGALTLVVPAASAVPSRFASTAAIGYAIGKPLCKAPTRRHFSCFAVRRVVVKKGTPGAQPFRIATATDIALGKKQTIGPAGGLTPEDLATAYGFNPAIGGTGQTVAIIDAFDDPNIESDLQAFDLNYGLSVCGNGCLTVVNEDGGTSPLPAPNSDWAGEIALDVETVHSVCENCKILLIEANSTSNSDIETAVDEAVKLKATEISNSYGGPEAGLLPADLAAYNHPGIVVTAATGDDGYFDFDTLASGGTNSPEFPASASTVVAVGGTSLELGQNGGRQSEAVWNDDGMANFWEQSIGIPLGATGGGCSTAVPAPGWQMGLSVWASTGCGAYRLTADISSDGDELTGFDTYDTYSFTGWSTVGGTSLAAPTIAAMFALAGGAHGVSYPALTLYGHLGSKALYDVTSGGNGYCGGEGAAQCGDPNTLGYGVVDCDYPATGDTPSGGDRACDALPGYDGPSGVGTPTGLGAFAKTGPHATVAGSSSVAHGTLTTWTATTTDPFPGGHVVKYSWNWGDATTPTVTTTGSASHTFAAAGTRTITVTVTDNYSQTGAVTKAVTVT